MPDFKNINDLGGLITSLPEDKIPDRNASDVLNMDFSLSGLAQTKKGYEIFGDTNSDAGECLRGYLYKKNFGALKRVKLKVIDDGTNSSVYWFNEDFSAEGRWELLVGSLTTGKVMGFAPFNNTNKNQLIMGNGEDNMSDWNGSTAVVSSVTANTITKTGTDTFAFEGFSSTGTVVINGVEYAYTGGTATTTLTGVTGNPSTGGVVANDGIVQKVDVTTHSGNPKGNILLTSGARLWVAGVKNRESQLYYSEVGTATNFTAGTNPDDPGIEDFPDGGGAITLLDSKDNNGIIIHKEDGVLLFRLEYTATAKIPYLDVLTLAEDAGASNLKAGAGINKVSYYTSQSEGIKSLERAIDGSDLNMESITDVILPTIKDYYFDEAAAIYFPEKRAIYVACATNEDVGHNDKVITYYVRRGVDGNYVGDISIDEGDIADWFVDGKKLYGVSSVDQNVYEFFGRNSKRGVSINHRLATKAFTHGEPALTKEFNTVYVEGFIKNRTKIKITVLYGLLGTGGSKSQVLEWNNNNYVTSQKVSALGTDLLGATSLGASNADINDSYAFSVPIHFDVNKHTRYKILVETEYDADTTPESYWAISNIATNPVLGDIDKNKLINSNT